MWWQPGRRKFPAAANGRRQCRSSGTEGERVGADLEGGRGGEKAPEVEMLMIPAGIGRSRMRSMLLKKRNACGSGEGDGTIDWRRAERRKRLGDVHAEIVKGIEGWPGNRFDSSPSK